jgi:hypothetical protein
MALGLVAWLISSLERLMSTSPFSEQFVSLGAQRLTLLASFSKYKVSIEFGEVDDMVESNNWRAVVEDIWNYFATVSPY